MSGQAGAFEGWAFVGAGIKTRQFQSLQEAVTWAGEFGEWVVLERAPRGWRPVRHGGARGRVVAGLVEVGETANEPPAATVARARELMAMSREGLGAMKAKLP